jgi:acetyl esterase
LDGEPALPVRLYSTGASGTAVVYAHGGGWAKGCVRAWDPMLSRLCQQSGAAIVSVDYRLAPEHPYPAAVDDMLQAVRAVAAGALFAPPRRLVVMGDSAGGYLAAVAARRMPERIALQVLLYPVVSPRCDTPTYNRYAVGHGLTAERMRWYWRLWAPQAAPGSEHDLLAGIGGPLPPAHIVVAEEDVLCWEGEAYANVLRRLGTPVSAERALGMTHGFVEYLRLLPQARRTLREVAARLRALPPV